MPRLISRVIQNSLKTPILNKNELETHADLAMKDAMFLVKLHDQVNQDYLIASMVWGEKLQRLVEKYQTIIWQGNCQGTSVVLSSSIAKNRPYPVEPGMAEAVRAAIRNHVTVWDGLEEEEMLDEWLRGHLHNQGETSLPDSSYKYGSGGRYLPNLTGDNEQETRACFDEQAEFERFKSGEDYTNGLSTMKDAIYGKQLKRMVSKFHALLKTGKVLSGRTIFIRAVPIPFLKEVPLVQGEWIDCYVAELAELGAMLENKGYEATKIDGHELAWPQYSRRGESTISWEELMVLWQKARRKIGKFQGRTQEIDGRLCISFSDFCSWSGYLRGEDLTQNIYDGFVTGSWNDWLDSGDSPGSLSGIVAHKLHLSVSEASFAVYYDSLAPRLKQRTIYSAHKNPGEACLRQATAEWREQAEEVLIELIAFEQAVAKIDQHYYAGEGVLFYDYANNLKSCVEELKALIDVFNDEPEMLSEDPLDIKFVLKEAERMASVKLAQLIDLAKVEVLTILGESQSAANIVARNIFW
ncbi:MAG: hypothetical protein FWH51_00015 [Dehalococcoidia bacterium]|nr:hypothetical protein [Dehalococcoidia bacterium]